MRSRCASATCGRFEPAGRAEMPYLEDKLSYIVAIDSGEIALDMTRSTL